MNLDFATEVSDKEVTFYGKLEMMNIIKALPDYINLPEEKKMALLPADAKTFDIDRESITGKVHWRCDFEFRDWGIKSISGYVKKIELQVSIRLLSQLPDDTFVFDTEFYWNSDENKDFVINNENDMSRTGVYRPVIVDIDLKKKNIQVQF